MEKEIFEYVIANIDNAIEQGWIEVFFQPVIRALTGRLCGMEALARWNDPQWGMLPPYRFIKPLEDNRLIHKLDCFVLEKVCETISSRVNMGQTVVPASINVSRLDFQLCDMFEVVENAIHKYDCPRDYIHIEITESIFVSDEGSLHEVIDKFRNAGYEIWMDDFGSGYSSLNLLKDYNFDMLKLDMDFLTSMTPKSRAILGSTVTMAKEIGLKTLAEGVETSEQYEFLRNIGCEQLQGFYFGRPQPIEDMMEHLSAKHIRAEERRWRHFYEIAGFHVKKTDIPLVILEDDGETFHTLFINRPYRDQLLHAHNSDMDLEELDRLIYNPASPLLQKYREFADITKKSSSTETFYYTDNGDYLRFRARCLAQHDGHYIIQGSIINISLDQNTSERDMLDNKLRALNLLFEVVDLINVESNVLASLLGRLKYIESDSAVFSDLKEAINRIVDNAVYAPEKDDFRKFMDTSTIRERVERSNRGYIEKIFRMKQSDGTYRRRDVIILMVPGAGGNEFLCCYRPVPDEVAKILDGLTASARSLVDKYLSEKGLVTYSELWENMIWDSSIKFFWKDRDRRFLGASQSFLDFYGIKSLDEIIGKTDEDMKWHVEEEPYMNDEIDIIQNGARVADVKGQCIVSGVVHDITCQKMPIYRNGEIIGLVGFFQDRDEELYRLENLALPSNIDRVTGLMNAKAFFVSMMDYAVEYSDKGRNYGVIVLRNSKHPRIMKSYGSDVSEKLLGQMGQRIIAVTGQSCAVARTKESIFAVLTYVSSSESLRFLAEDIKNSIDKITDIDGNSVTVITDITYVMRTDEGVTDENIYSVALNRIQNIDELSE